VLREDNLATSGDQFSSHSFVTFYPWTKLGRMNLDKRLRRSNFLPTSLKNLLLQKQRDGYISPPLHAPKEGTRNSVKRIGIVLLFVVFALYLSGFVLPGFGGPKNQKVVIILAANLGGGSAFDERGSNGRCSRCEKIRGLGDGKD
jgi:hypothetical protein